MTYLETIGLFLNLIGAIILAVPLLNYRKTFHETEDRLIDLGTTEDGEYRYTTERDKKIARLARCGGAMIIMGFLLQLISNIYK